MSNCPSTPPRSARNQAPPHSSDLSSRQICPDSPLQSTYSLYTLPSFSSSKLATSAVLFPSTKKPQTSLRTKSLPFCGGSGRNSSYSNIIKKSEGTRSLNLFTKAAFAEENEWLKPPPTPTFEIIPLESSPARFTTRNFNKIRKNYLPSPELEDSPTSDEFSTSYSSDSSSSSSLPSPKSLRRSAIALPSSPYLRSKRSRLEIDSRDSLDCITIITEKKLIIDHSEDEWPSQNERVYGGWSYSEEQPTLGLGLLGM